MPPIEYSILVEGVDDDGKAYSIPINWGNESEWVRRFKDALDGAERITLFPKEGAEKLPIVSMCLDGHRWIVFSRVFGRTNTRKRIRLHALGWQDTVHGKNVKALIWIYPNGTIELAKEPSFVDLFFE